MPESKHLSAVAAAVPVALAIVTIGLWGGPSKAEDSSTLITIQARITNDGAPITASLPLVVEIHASASGASPLWSEAHDAVSVVNGLACLELGSRTAFPPGLFDPPGDR